MPLEQCHRRDDHTRCANAALRASTFKESRLHGIEFLVVRNAFDRTNVGAIRLHGGNEAAIDDRAVQQYRARATFALAATFLRSGKLHFFPQNVEQTCHRVRRHFAQLAVDRAGNIDPPHSVRQARPP